MNSYFTLAVVLTIAYITYYVVVIAYDIYRKRGMDKPNEEVFDLGVPEEEESTTVTESETGFNISGENYGMESTATFSEASPENVKGGPGAAWEKLERLKAEVEEQIEETVPYPLNVRTPEEVCKAMISEGRLGGRPEIK